jgi:hypothetical protein
VKEPPPQRDNRMPSVMGPQDETSLVEEPPPQRDNRMPSVMGPQDGTSPVEEPAPIAASRGPLDPTNLVTAIVAALGDNGTEPARSTLEQVLAGTFPTDDDKIAVEAVLSTLAAHPSPQNDALLLRAIVEPEALRPADRQGPWPAKSLRTRALTLVKLSGCVTLRTELAETLANRLVRVIATDPISGFLLAPDPINCGAQLLLYQKPNSSMEIRNRMEQQLTGYSSGLLAELLELRGGKGVGKTQMHAPSMTDYAPTPTQMHAPSMTGYTAAPVASIAVDAKLLPQLTSLLWSKDFRGSVESELGKFPHLDKPQLAMLAGTMPFDSTRAALAKVLKKRWDDGPAGFEALGLPDSVVADPALLVLMKMNPRREIKASRLSTGAMPRDDGGGLGRSDVMTAAQRKQKAELAWMEFSGRTVSAWCGRLNALAQAKDKAAAESGNLASPAEPKLPADFALSEGARFVAAHHVLLPDQAPAALADQPPDLLEIHYVCAGQTSTMRKAFAYYASQAKSKTTDDHKIGDAIWIDSVRLVPQSGRRRSIDVLLTRADKQPFDAVKDVEEADLIVEILIVEIKDPLGRE